MRKRLRHWDSPSQSAMAKKKEKKKHNFDTLLPSYRLMKLMCNETVGGALSRPAVVNRCKPAKKDMSTCTLRVMFYCTHLPHEEERGRGNVRLAPVFFLQVQY